MLTEPSSPRKLLQRPATAWTKITNSPTSGHAARVVANKPPRKNGASLLSHIPHPRWLSEVTQHKAKHQEVNLPAGKTEKAVKLLVTSHVPALVSKAQKQFPSARCRSSQCCPSTSRSSQETNKHISHSSSSFHRCHEALPSGSEDAARTPPRAGLRDVAVLITRSGKQLEEKEATFRSTNFFHGSKGLSNFLPVHTAT